MRRCRPILQIYGRQGNFFPYSHKVDMHKHSFSTQSQDYASYPKIKIEVGGTVQLNFSQGNTKMNVWTSDNFEEIELKAWWKHNMNSLSPFNLNMKNNHLCVSLEYGEEKDNLQTLGVVMPGRWCNLVLQAGKGDVIIQDMKEANTHVTTTGGNINLGALRGNEAFFKSGGGSIIAGLVSGILEIRTDGGNLTLNKAIGTGMVIDTNGGEMNIGSVYGGDVKLNSGHGCIEMKHIQAQGKAIVSSDGGNIKIGGLDGNAEIFSNGGNIELQLLENAKEIKIDAGIGDVTLYGTRKNDIQIQYTKEQRFSRKHESNDESGSNTKEIYGPRVLILSCGHVITKERSWLDSVMKK